jgi:hypothetical protein
MITDAKALLGRASLGLLAAAFMVGCEHREGLFDPSGPGDPPSSGSPSVGVPQINLGTGTVHLFVGDTVVITFSENVPSDTRGQLYLLSGTRSVLWRSPQVVATGNREIKIAIEGISDVPRETELLLTASVQGSDGVWYFASTGMEAITSVARAAVRPAIIYDSEVYQLGPGADVVALSSAPGIGKVFFADRSRAQIGVFDIASHDVSGSLPMETGPTWLAYRGNTLTALSAGGTRISTFNASVSNTILANRSLIPTLVVRTVRPDGPPDDQGVQRFITERVPVRPYARRLTVGCAPGSGSCVPVAFADSEANEFNAMRRLYLGPNFPFGPDVVVPNYVPLGQDTVPAHVTGFTASAFGSDSVVAQNQFGSRCLTFNLGAGRMAASPIPGGPLYVASPATSMLCGGGTRIVRINQPGSQNPTFSAVSMRNLLGEDRIGPIQEIEVSEDGQRLLVLGTNAVYLLDAELRLLGTLEYPGATGVSWLKDPENPATRLFGVLDSTGVNVFDAAVERMVLLHRVSLGRTEPGHVEFMRYASEFVVMAVGEGRRVLLASRFASF